MRRLAVLVVTGLAVAYILWQINVRETLHVLAHASFGWWLLSCAIWIGAVWPLAWRWRIRLAARGAVGVDLPPRSYYVMGPLLFLVMLVPFTINGLAVRESFFVSFLGNLGVSADRAFSTGFLFFVVTLVTALPGAPIIGWEGVNRAEPRPAR